MSKQITVNREALERLIDTYIDLAWDKLPTSKKLLYTAKALAGRGLESPLISPLITDLYKD